MDDTRLDPAWDHVLRSPPDDFADDAVIEMAHLDETDTHIPGTVFISTALGSHRPRAKWFPGSAGRALPCLIMSIGNDPVLRDDVLPAHISRPAIPPLRTWIVSNHVALLDFWKHGDSWNRRRVSAFLDGLVPVSR